MKILNWRVSKDSFAISAYRATNMYGELEEKNTV